MSSPIQLHASTIVLVSEVIARWFIQSRSIGKLNNCIMVIVAQWNTTTNSTWNFILDYWRHEELLWMT